MAEITPEKLTALVVVALVYLSIIGHMIRQAVKRGREAEEFQPAPEEVHDNKESRT